MKTKLNIIFMWLQCPSFFFFTVCMTIGIGLKKSPPNKASIGDGNKCLVLDQSKKQSSCKIK